MSGRVTQEVTPAGPEVARITPLNFSRVTVAGSVTSVVVVGCGGIGARIIPALVKMLMPGSTVYAVDLDVVDEHNLLRQHFTKADVGIPKAEVMARKYSTEAVPVVPLVGDVAQAAPELRDNLPSYSVLIGAVDNPWARYQILRLAHDHHLFYIDAGNDGIGGQVLLNGHVSINFTDGRRQVPEFYLQLHGWNEYPHLFDPKVKDEAPTCGTRIDTQIVTANNMAAAAALNYFGMWLYAWPIMNLGVTFSTLNTFSPVRMQLMQDAYYNMALAPFEKPRGRGWKVLDEIPSNYGIAI